MNALDELMIRTVEASQDASVTIRFGRVTAVNGQTITVEFAGAPVSEIPCVSSYNPVAGDWAWLLRQGSLLVAIGCTKGTVNDEGKK